MSGCGPAGMRGWFVPTVGATDECLVPGGHHDVNAPPEHLFTLLVGVKDR